MRKAFSFDVIELQTVGLVKVGTWEEGKKFEFQRPQQKSQLIDIEEDSLVNKTFRVLISVPVSGTFKRYSHQNKTHIFNLEQTLCQLGGKH